MTRKHSTGPVITLQRLDVETAETAVEANALRRLPRPRWGGA